MTAITEHDLGVLLQRGLNTPVELQLTRGWESGEPRFFFNFAHVPAVFTEEEGLQVERHGMNLRIHHNDKEVLRRTKDTTWYFPQDSELPFRHGGSEVQIMEPLRFIIEPYRMWFEYYPLSRMDVAQAITSTVAGHDTWRIPVHARDEGGLSSLDIDVETGAVLAAESALERIQAVTVSYPQHIADPTWTGKLAEVPASTVSIAPLKGENHIRIYANRHDERHFHGVRVGDVMHLPLLFKVDPDAPVHRRITRRGQVINNHGELNNGQWEAHFINDGWHAALTSPTPLIGEIEVTGVLEPSPHDDGPTTSFEVVLIHDTEEMLIDANPRPHHAPIEPYVFQPFNAVIDDAFLWFSDARLPVVRQWSLETGEYCGEAIIPTPIQPAGPSIYLSRNGLGQVVATWEGNHWLVKDGSTFVYERSEPAPVQPAPVLPAGWITDHFFDDGLFSAYSLPPLKNALTMHIGLGNRLQPLDTNNGGVSRGFMMDGKIIVTTGEAEYHLDDDLQLLETIKIADRASYEIFDDLLLRSTDTRGQFLIRSTGEELCSINWHQPCPLKVTREHIIVLMSFEELATWTPQTGWRTVELGGRR